MRRRRERLARELGWDSQPRDWYIVQDSEGAVLWASEDVATQLERLDAMPGPATTGRLLSELDTVVNDDNWDDPKFLPLFKAAEAMGAVLFFHPQPHHNVLLPRTSRYGLPNSLGVIIEDTLIVAILIFGGIFEACPRLKVCIAHGGGLACLAMGRMDRGWRGRPDARVNIPEPPSAYQRRLYYDTVVGNEVTLRFLMDQVGADRVVLGSDWPFVPWDPSPVGWVRGLKSLTQEEKEGVLSQNVEALLEL